MSTNLYPIYVISLKRTPERRLHIQRQLNALNLNYQFVDAIDKYDLRSSQYQSEVADLLGIKKSTIERRSTSDGTTACALSHAKAYNLMVERRDSVACILEDDSYISPNFPKLLNMKQKMSWDILMLSSQSFAVFRLLGSNPNIQRSIREFPEIDCSLFLRLRDIEWFKRLLQPMPVSCSELDWTLISKWQWFLLIFASQSRITNELCRCLIKIYNYLPQRTKTDLEQKYYVACKIGGLPVRSSQQNLCDGYDTAIPAEKPTSGMAYLLTIDAVSQLKKAINSMIGVPPIDILPWYLYRKRSIKLRILTPPCVTASFSYLKNSLR